MRGLPIAALGVIASAWLQAQTPSPRPVFRIKYVAEGVVYIDGGRAAGLAEKMKLTVERVGESAPLAEIEVASIAEASAVCEVRNARLPLQPGDTAALSVEDAQRVEILRAAGSKRYPQVVTFTEGDPLDEEVRETAPHPPLPEINRIRGRIGFEYNGIRQQGGMAFNEFGAVLRTDMTRIGGTYWNLTGYTRILSNSSAGPGQQTLNDLLNRTYRMTLSYDNPHSNWVAGFGRFYLPWAASLNTIDGGYLGRRYAGGWTAGVFAGTSPDPTSWNYSPGRQMLGTFVNFEQGSFDSVKFTSTAGVGITRLSWEPERQFLFFENTIYYKRYFSIYHDLQADKLHQTTQQPAAAPAIARSFLTLRFQPVNFIAFDLSHNYFRDFPTFDPRLVGTGLLDKYLFQGLSGGVRVTLPYRLQVYTNLGRSSRTGDQRSSLNRMFGLAATNILGTGIRGDFHLSRFDSSFGRGEYKALTLSREVRETLQFQLQAGQQNYNSTLTAVTRARFITGSVDWFFATHYFLGGGLTVYRGQTQSYNQTYFTLGYRF
jgi:hypothetical protein